MKNVKVCYSKDNNLGDSLNRLIIENVIGDYKVIRSNRFICDTSGIGSGLGRFFVPESKLLTTKGKIAYTVGKLSGHVQIWSAGFFNYAKEREVNLIKNVDIASVRGELSKKRLEKILDRKLDITVGDGGLLASMLIKENITKEYKIGIIPHKREINEDVFKNMKEHYKNSVLIDITANPLEVVETIGKCQYILSSGLHGLVVADSFHIPNICVKYSNKLKGDGFKFDDYYSSYNVESKIYDLYENNFPEIEYIEDNYSISMEAVEQKKEEIIEAFKLYL